MVLHTKFFRRSDDTFSNQHTMSQLLGRSVVTKARLKNRKKHVVQLLLVGLCKPQEIV